MCVQATSRYRCTLPLSWVAVACFTFAVLPGLAHAALHVPTYGQTRQGISQHRTRNRQKSAPTAGSALLGGTISPWLGFASVSQSIIRTSRFVRPWRVVVPPKMLTVGEAKGRVLYSAVKTMGSDGLGHAMSIINADVAAALRLGLAYSHRVGLHGSLTVRDTLAVERFFGWGVHALQREKVFAACADGTRRVVLADECPVCTTLEGGGRWERGTFERIVNIPLNLSYAIYHTHHTQSTRAAGVDAFLRQHPLPNTIFQMPPSLCRRFPAQSFFSPATRSHFYIRYWDARKRDQVNVPLRDSELNIAIHARRGDFFRVRRPMTRVGAFAVAVRQAMEVVHANGGQFSRMPVVVRVYSEGEPFNQRPLSNHDVSRMSDRFLDADGVLRGPGWIRETILGNYRYLFRYGLRIEMRIARDTLDSAHEMIAADMFFGSLSGLSTQVVGTLSRAGVIAVPVSLNQEDKWLGHCSIVQESGKFRNITEVSHAWAEYTAFYERHASRAVLDDRERAFAEAPVMPD